MAESDPAFDKLVAAFCSVGVSLSEARMLAGQMTTPRLTADELKGLITNEAVQVQAKRNGSARVQFIDTARKAVRYVDEGGASSEAVRRIRKGLDALDRHARRNTQPR